MKKKRGYAVLFVFTASILMLSCQKESFVSLIGGGKDEKGHLKQTKTFSSDVAIQWLKMQVRLMKANPTDVGNVTFSRHYAYSGITLYESVVAGMPACLSLASQLNDLSDLPKTVPGSGYHWAASANAALAFINKKLFPNASEPNKAALDSLENALHAKYLSESNEAIIQRSVDYGRAVAQKIFDWANTDGYAEGLAGERNIPFTYPPGVAPGPHLWVPPATWSIQTASYWKNVRTLVPNSGTNAQPPAPPAFSTNPASAFYLAAKEVQDLKPAVGSPNEAMALWWRDVPGTSTPGHYISVLQQVLEKEQSTLDVAATAYALGGIMVFDASISTWQTKFTSYLVRPTTYINSNIGSWTPVLGTPPHPEYPSAHSSLSAANAEAMSIVFGDNYSFNDNTFEYLWPGSTRHYSSFRTMADEAGLSRIYGGIHYRFSVDAGLQQGRKVADNIKKKLKLLK